MEKVCRIDVVRCMMCNTCAAICPSDAIHFNSKSYAYIVDESKCTGCGACENACPARAAHLEDR